MFPASVHFLFINQQKRGHHGGKSRPETPSGENMFTTKRRFSKRVAIGVFAVAALTLAGCTGTSDSAAPSVAPEGKPSDGTLVVYSPQGEGARGDYIAQHAQEELGIKVEFVTGGGGELAVRILAEKNNSQADVVLGLAEAQIAPLDEEGLFQSYTPKWADTVPEEFQRADAGYALFSQTPIVMAYNPDYLDAAKAPKSWEDLAKPAFKNAFVFPAATSQTGQAAIAGILWRFADPETGEVSDEGWDVLTKIMQNAKPLGQGEAFDWNWVQSGELPVIVNWLGGIQTGAADFSLPLEVIEAKGGSPFVNTGVGIVAGSRLNDAERFVDWFGSAEFQVGFVEATNNDTPLNMDAVAELPDAEAALANIVPQEVDWSVASTKLPEWLERVQLEILG